MMLPRGLSAVSNLIRRCVLIVAFFVTVDAGVCPVVCLATESTQAHAASNLPVQPGPSTACAGCAAGVVALDAGLADPLTAAIRHPGPHAVASPPSAPAVDIDHPPRRS
jgi:hypothetical protein